MCLLFVVFQDVPRIPEYHLEPRVIYSSVVGHVVCCASDSASFEMTRYDLLHDVKVAKLRVHDPAPSPFHDPCFIVIPIAPSSRDFLDLDFSDPSPALFM